MKRQSLFLSAAALLAVAFLSLPALFAQGGHDDHKPSDADTLTGEVLDLHCFMLHPDNSTGADHAKCAKSCINKGLAPGLLVDGQVYLLLGSGHSSLKSKVAKYAGSTITVTGEVFDHHGMKAFQVSKIEEAGDAPKASAAYVCPMHPEVTSDKPDKCSKCGMALKKKGDSGGHGGHGGH